MISVQIWIGCVGVDVDSCFKMGSVGVMGGGWRGEEEGGRRGGGDGEGRGWRVGERWGGGSASGWTIFWEEGKEFEVGGAGGGFRGNRLQPAEDEKL